MDKKVIILEYNELVPYLIDRFIEDGQLPNFKRLRNESIIAVTDAEEKFPNLEPWIQWVTVHTGLTFAEHQVFDLDDGPKLKAPRVWDLVSDAGKPIWICGSMNAAVQGDSILGLVLPDPWATGLKGYPAGFFDPYLDLVRTYVQEYTAERPQVSKAAFLRFGRFMLANGLSAKTVMDTLRQLAGELRAPIKWRRAAILERLQWDLFRNFYRKEKPALATFFLNSTAHYQHYFWRNMEPEIFLSKPSEEQQAKYVDVIPFGYRKMDEIIGEAFGLADAETSIVLCTALSQQPMLTHEEIGGKQIFKPNDQARLFAYAGVTQSYDYAPVMAEQFHLVFRNEADAAAAELKIAGLQLDSGEELMLVRRDGNRIFSGCKLEQRPAAGARVVSTVSNGTVAFEEMFHPVEAVRSGMHHPQGMLWIRTPERRHALVDRKIALTEIAPTLLELAGVQTNHRFSMPPLPELHEPVCAWQF